MFLPVIKCGRTSPTDLAGFDFKLTFYKLGLIRDALVDISSSFNRGRYEMSIKVEMANCPR